MTAIKDKYSTMPAGYDSLALLVRKPTCTGITDMIYEEFTENWREELFASFQYVLLSDIARAGANKWREDFELNINTSRVVPIRYDSSGFFPDRDVDALFQIKGRVTRGAFNPHHPEAQTVKGARLSCAEIDGEVRFVYAIEYGYPDDDTSNWQLRLVTHNGEAFCDFAYRAFVWVNSKTTEARDEVA